jgi:DNA-binding transcriptional LysR family regulator
MITLNRLRQAVCLAEHRSFHRAAATLQISQPALTKSIQTLEAALGVRLFDRQQGGVVLTEFGELVVEYTRRMAATESELRQRIDLLAGLEAGSVKVALGPYPSVMSAYAATGNLVAKHPKLHVSLLATNWRDVSRLVAEKKVDLGIAELTDAVLDESLQTEQVGRHRGRFFCRPGHPILAKSRISLPDLLAFPWATTRIPPRLAAAFPRSIGPAGRIDTFNGDFVPAIELDVPMQLARLTHGGDVIAVGAFAMVEHDLDAGTLAVIPTPRINIHSSYGFIHVRNRALPPAVTAFMQEVRDEEARCVQRETELERRFLTERRESAQPKGTGRKRAG